MKTTQAIHVRLAIAIQQGRKRIRCVEGEFENAAMQGIRDPKDNKKFIADSAGKPVATAEILPGGNLGQFYGNELVRDPEKMKPCKDAEKVVSRWLKKFKDSNIKIKPRKEAA